MNAMKANMSAKNALPHDVPKSVFTTQRVMIKLKIVPSIPNGPKTVPSIVLNIIRTNTHIIAFPKEDSSIPANLAPIHKNTASITINAIKPMMPKMPNAPIVNGSIICTPKIKNDIQYLNFVILNCEFLQNTI